MTIDLADSLYLEQEKLAEELGLSRDELYTLALEEYAKKRLDDLDSAKLDAFYATYKMDEFEKRLLEENLKSLREVEWGE